MTALHDRLADLAGGAPAGAPTPDLWTRGRRVHRRQRAGTVVIVGAACLALFVVLGLTWQRSAPPPEPVPANAPAGLPDRIWQPSKWLPDAVDSGLLGQVAAIVPAERGSWTGASGGVIGISARTGEYRFLDLPDRAEGAVALAPDGRHVAYWTKGETTASPNTAGPVVGVAIYDTTTGEVERHDVATEHGLGPEVLAWADEDRLLVGYGRYVGGVDDDPTTQGMTTGSRLWAWTVGEDAPVGVDVGNASAGAFVGVAGDGVFVLSGGGDSSYVIRSLDDPGWSAGFRIPRADNPFNYPVVDRTGTVTAVLWGGAQPDQGHAPNQVLAGPARAPGGAADLDLVPSSGRTSAVLDWVDTDRLVVRRYRDLDEGGATIERLDVRTGETTRLVSFEASDIDDGGTSFATDLFDAPTHHAQEPPSPIDPRLVTGLVAGTVLVAALALVLWRRRVRP
jgi:hypothetical protein